MLKAMALAWQALRLWKMRQLRVALIAAVLIGVVIGVATVLIPNPMFARDIAPVWWNYPVWILTSLVSGMLLATYLRPVTIAGGEQPEMPEGDAPDSQHRQGKLGMAGAFLSWFAVGCPVCNKLALIAFGYSGAITYFAPVQPILGVAALLLAGIALVWRLKGQIVCSIPVTRASDTWKEESESTHL